jgi:hypothetical protein
METDSYFIDKYHLTPVDLAGLIADVPLFMRVTALADDILRVRAAAAEDLPEDASWAVPEEMRRLNDRDNHKDGQVWPRIENL